MILYREAAAGRIVVGQHRLGEADILAIVARIDESTNGIQALLSGLKSLQINGFRLPFNFPTSKFGCKARQI
jgi:hypothetical protein